MGPSTHIAFHAAGEWRRRRVMYGFPRGMAGAYLRRAEPPRDFFAAPLPRFRGIEGGDVFGLTSGLLACFRAG